MDETALTDTGLSLNQDRYVRRRRHHRGMAVAVRLYSLAAPERQPQGPPINLAIDADRDVLLVDLEADLYGIIGDRISDIMYFENAAGTVARCQHELQIAAEVDRFVRHFFDTEKPGIVRREIF